MSHFKAMCLTLALCLQPLLVHPSESPSNQTRAWLSPKSCANLFLGTVAIGSHWLAKKRIRDKPAYEKESQTMLDAAKADGAGYINVRTDRNNFFADKLKHKIYSANDDFDEIQKAVTFCAPPETENTARYDNVKQTILLYEKNKSSNKFHNEYIVPIFPKVRNYAIGALCLLNFPWSRIPSPTSLWRNTK